MSSRVPMATARSGSLKGEEAYELAEAFAQR